jgi:hypothetical protein
MGGVKAVIEQMIEGLQSTLEDAEKFDNGNNTAGTRVRKALLVVKDQAHNTRQLVSQIKSNR